MIARLPTDIIFFCDLVTPGRFVYRRKNVQNTIQINDLNRNAGTNIEWGIQCKRIVSQDSREFDGLSGIFL